MEIFRPRPWSLALLALLGAPARAADYFVNDTSLSNDAAFTGCSSMGIGADAPSCGTCASPCASLQYAYNQLPLGPGDTVYVNTGTYTVGAQVPILSVDNPVKTGTATNMLTFRGPTDSSGRAATLAGIPLVLLDGQEQATAGVLVRVPGIRLQGLGITRTNPNVPCNNNTTCGSAVRIMVPDVVTSFEVIGLDVYGLQTLENAVDVDQANTVCDRCLIDNNYFHDSTADQAIFLAGLSGVEIRRNRINAVQNQGLAPAIQMDGLSNAIIANNVISNCGGAAVFVRQCFQCASGQGGNNLFENNTFVHNQQLADPGTSLAEVRLEAGFNIVRNNIINPVRQRAVYLTSFTTATLEYNGYFLEGTAALARIGGTDYPSLPAWQGAGKDLQSIVADPLFIGPSDFHLQSPAGFSDRSGAYVSGAGSAASSPFIDRGNPASAYALEHSPHGARVDLGGYGNTPENSLTPVSLAISSGDAQVGYVGAALAQPLSIALAYATSGAPAPNETVDFEVVLGGGSLGASTAITDAQGIANATAVLGASGENRFQASIPSTSPVLFRATAIYHGSIQPPGASCFQGSDCATGACANTVCCDTRCDGACETCLQATGAAADGVCTLVSKGTICRAPAGPCDLADRCDGVSRDCAEDALLPRGARGEPTCPAPLLCSGMTVRCGCYSDDHCPQGAMCVSGRCVARALSLPARLSCGFGAGSWAQVSLLLLSIALLRIRFRL